MFKSKVTDVTIRSDSVAIDKDNKHRSNISVVLFQGISANIEYFGFEVDIKQVFAGNQISRCPWEFQSDIFLVGLLLCYGLDFFCHLLVHFQQLVQL